MGKCIRDWLKPPNPELELLRHMDRVSALIADLSRMIRKTRGKNEQRYWMGKWEEAVMVRMEFEWNFHPDNKEPT